MATEEQIQYNAVLHIYGAAFIRGGQKLTIPNRTVTKLGFWLSRTATATGEITYTIRKVSDDDAICSKVALDAGDLTVTPTYHEVVWDTPPTIDEEVRLCVEPDGVSGAGYVDLSVQDGGGVKPAELTCWYIAAWTDSATYDTAYIYTYTNGWTGKISGVTNPAKVMGVDVANIAEVKGVTSA